MPAQPDQGPRREEWRLTEHAGGDILLEMENIQKEYPGGVRANKGIDLGILRGEVHALLGENGSGKTTLMNILNGLVKSDSGQIRMNGRPISIHAPRDAIDQGIGMVHQHFMLIPQFTVAENVVLGVPKDKTSGAFPAIERKVRDLSERYGFQIDTRAKVSDIPLGMRQRVEVLKALYRNAKLLVLDEPTAVLTPQEVGELIKILRHLVEEGHSIVFISHKLEEVLSVSDRITVLRDGEVVGTAFTKDVNHQILANMMVGRGVFLRIERPPSEPGPVAIELVHVSAHDDLGAQRLVDLDLEVHEGEILGIAGIDGNGQRELAEVCTGIRKPTEGSIRIFGEEVNGRGIRQFQRLGVGHIHEDRQSSGLILDFNIAENLVLEAYMFPPYAWAGLLRPEAIEENARHLIGTFSIKAPHPRVPARTLSGGNQQRVALARTLASRPRIVVASQPTRGLDVAATEYVRNLLVTQRTEGAGVLLISTELDEIFDLSDRIAVFYSGHIMGIVSRDAADVNTIGRMMTGTPLSELERRL